MTTSDSLCQSLLVGLTVLITSFSPVQSSEVEGLRVVSRPGRKLLQCTTEAACRARCPPGNNIIYLAPQDGTSGQCVCICSPTNSPQNSTPNTRSGGLIGSSLGGTGSFAQPLGGGGGGGSSAGNGGIGSQSSAGSTNPNSGSGDTSGGTGTVQSVGSGTATSSASQQGSNLVGSVTSAGSSSDTTTATLVNSATGAGSRGTTTSSSRNPSQSG